MLNLGLCSIGDLNTEKVVEALQLKSNEVLINTIEFGLKKDEELSEYAVQIREKIHINTPYENLTYLDEVNNSATDEEKEEINEVEERLIDICEEILGIENIKVNDNFFDVGRYSVQVAT